MFPITLPCCYGSLRPRPIPHDFSLSAMNISSRCHKLPKPLGLSAATDGDPAIAKRLATYGDPSAIMGKTAATTSVGASRSLGNLSRDAHSELCGPYSNGPNSRAKLSSTT